MNTVRLAGLILCAALLTACPRPPEGVPTANFTVTPAYGPKPLEATFMDTSLPGDSPITAWVWDFGDGTAGSTAQNPQHTYTANGTYSVELTVTNAQGSSTTLKSAAVIVGNVWAETDGFSGDDSASSVAAFSNGDVVVLSSVTLAGRDDMDLQVQRRNQDGSTDWTWTFGGEEDEFAGGVIVTSDGDVVACGTTESFGAGNQDVYVIRLDGNSGIEDWSETYGTFLDDTANALAESGSAIAVAGKTTTLTRLSDAYLLKIDADGELVWSKSYGTTAQEAALGIGAADGGFILAGEQSGASVQCYVVRVDSDGDELWSSSHGGTGADRGYAPFKVGDNYAVIGTGYSATITGYDVMLLNLDKDGKATSTHYIGGVGREDGYAAVRSGGNFIVAGRTSTATAGEDDYDVYLASITSGGERNWARTLGGLGDDIANGIASVSGDFVLAGSTDSWGEGGTDSYLLRTNGQGFGPAAP